MFISKRSNGVYYIHYINAEGKRAKISTGVNKKSEAIKFLTQFENEVNERRIKKLKPILLKEYCKSFLNYSKTIHTIKTHKGYTLTLSYLQKHCENLHLNEITQNKLTEYFKQRINKSSIYQARKDLICFNSLFNRAVIDGYLLINPCKHIQRFKIPQKQPHFFSDFEFELLLKTITEQDIKDLVIFALNTGLRQMELLTLEWSQINFKERLVILDNRNHVTKSKRIRTIPLSIKALQVLSDKERRQHGTIVFTLKNRMITQNYLTHKFKEYVLEAGINPKLNFHSIRHTFASWLVQKGVSIYEVSKLLGHTRVEITQIYSHLSAEDLRPAVNKLNN